MLARAIVVITAGMLLAACVNSERLRSSLGGPATAVGTKPDASK